VNLHELTTNQKVAGSSPAERTTESPVLQGFLLFSIDRPSDKYHLFTTYGFRDDSAQHCGGRFHQRCERITGTGILVRSCKLDTSIEFAHLVLRTGLRTSMKFRSGSLRPHGVPKTPQAGVFSEGRLLGGCAAFPCGAHYESMAHYGSMKHCRKEDTLEHTARHVPSSVLNVRAWHPDLVEP
jgi:hypothetical protein